MALYFVKNEEYDIPEDKITDFLAEFPDAEKGHDFLVGDQKYSIPEKKVEEFKLSFPNAVVQQEVKETKPIEGIEELLQQPDISLSESEGTTIVKPKEKPEVKPEGVKHEVPEDVQGWEKENWLKHNKQVEGVEGTDWVWARTASGVTQMLAHPAKYEKPVGEYEGKPLYETKGVEVKGEAPDYEWVFKSPQFKDAIDKPANARKFFEDTVKKDPQWESLSEDQKKKSEERFEEGLARAMLPVIDLVDVDKYKDEFINSPLWAFETVTQRAVEESAGFGVTAIIAKAVGIPVAAGYELLKGSLWETANALKWNPERDYENLVKTYETLGDSPGKDQVLQEMGRKAEIVKYRNMALWGTEQGRDVALQKLDELSKFGKSGKNEKNEFLKYEDELVKKLKKEVKFSEAIKEYPDAMKVYAGEKMALGLLELIVTRKLLKSQALELGLIKGKGILAKSLADDHAGLAFGISTAISNNELVLSGQMNAFEASAGVIKSIATGEMLSALGKGDLATHRYLADKGLPATLPSTIASAVATYGSVYGLEKATGATDADAHSGAIMMTAWRMTSAPRLIAKYKIPYSRKAIKQRFAENRLTPYDKFYRQVFMEKRPEKVITIDGAKMRKLRIDGAKTDEDRAFEKLLRTMSPVIDAKRDDGETIRSAIETRNGKIIFPEKVVLTFQEKDWFYNLKKLLKLKHFEPQIKEGGDFVVIMAGGGEGEYPKGGERYYAETKEDLDKLYLSDAFKQIAEPPTETKPTTITGYRGKDSAEKGKYGTFYTLKDQDRETVKTELSFNNLLVVEAEKVGQFVGLPAEALAVEWFPDYDFEAEADKLGVEEGELMDKMVTEEAIKRGYDGIKFGEHEVVDLRVAEAKPEVEKEIEEIEPEVKDEVFAISGDGMVYHTTAKSAVERIKNEGFKTGKELNIAEKRGAIYFSAKDVNEGVYARNREGELYEGEDSATIGINIEGLNLLDITSPEMHKRWSAIKTRGDVDQIPKEYDGTISRLADGRIYEVMLRKDVANSRLTESVKAHTEHAEIGEPSERISMTIDEFAGFFAEINNLLEDKRVDDAHKTLYDMGERMGSINWSELTQADRTSVLDTFSELKDRIDESKEKKIEMVGDKMKEVPIPTYAEQYIPILKELDAKYEGIEDMPKGKFISFTDNQTGSTLLVHKDKANKEAFEKKLEESRTKWKESEKVERGEVGRFKNIQQADEFMDRIVQRVYVFSNETETIAKLIENQKDIVKNLKKADREKFDRDLQELIGTNAIYNRMTGNVKAQVKTLNHQINTLERELETNEDLATEKLLSKQYDELEDKVEAIETRELEKLRSGKDIFKDKTDASAYDRLIPGVAKQEDINYEYFEKGREGKVVWMSPDEYFDQVVAGFGKPRKEVIEGMIDTGSMATIGRLIMEGTKIDMPFLDYTSLFGQEGRNRAMALKELGIEKMPVLVMRKVSEKDIEERIRKVRSDILKSADLDKEGYLEEAREKLKEEGYRKDVIDQILDPRSIASQAPKFRKSGKLLPSETETLKEQGTWDQRMVEDQERAQKILSSIDAHIRTHEGIESNSSIIPQIELNDAQKTAMDISEKFFNVPAVWVKNNINAFAGVYQDGYMFLNTKNSDPVGLVVFHEGVHHLKKSDPDLYYELLALFEYSMGMSDISTKDLLRFYKKQGIPKTLEQVVEEALADYVGENRGSQEFWNEFIDKSPNLWQRVWRYFQKLIEKIKTMFDKRVSGLVKNTEQLDKVIKKHFDKVKGVGGKKFEITERQQSKIRAYYTDSEMMSIPEFIKAWHGSRAKHDRFSMKFVGSGEGINAYAWGMYFGGKRGIGEHYRRNLSDHILKRNGKIIKSETEDNTTVGEMFIFMDMREGASRSVILKRIEDFVAVIENKVAKLSDTYKRDSGIVKYYENRLKEATSVYEDFKAGKYEIETTGFLYEAELWETGEPELLIWGEQLPETQYQRLTGYLNELINDADIASDKDKSGYWKDVSLYYKGILEALPSTSASAGAFYNAIADQIGDEKASILLEGAGFDGVQYMAGALSGAKDGTLNYVVFDERAIRILKRNDEPLYYILNPDKVKPKLRRSPFKKGDIDAKRIGKETIEGVPKEGLGEEQQEVPSIRLRDFEKDGLEAKERKVKPKKISNVMLNRVERLYYEAGSVVNFENMLKRNKISRDTALKALEILHDEKRLRPPMPKPVDPVKIKKKRIRGNMPTKKKAEPKVDTVQLPSDFINAYNTPYLHYWSLSTTNDVRFKGYKIGSRSLYSETGKPLDMIWEEVGQGEKELAGHLYRDSEDEMTQGVLDEIDALQTNGTPMQIMERQDDRGAEEAGRTSDVMTDLEYATMSEEVEKFLKDSEELSKKKGDSFVISLMDLQVGDKLEIYNSDLGEFKNVEVVNIDTDNDQIELKASDESYFLDLWGKIRATGAIEFNEPFRTLDKDNQITARTKDAFGKKLLEFMGAPKPKPSETITKEGVINNTYPKTTAYDEGYDLRQSKGLDGKTRVVLSVGTLRDHDHLSRDIKILKDKGFEVSPTAILTNESKIYNKDTGRWVVVYGVTTPGAVEALKRMTVDYDIIPDGSNPRRIFVYDSDPGLRDASLPIGEAGVVDMTYDPRTHIDFINTRLPEGVEKKVKNIVAQVVEDAFMNNKGMVTWDAEPLIDQAINELMSQNNWDTKISNEERWAKPIHENIREDPVEYIPYDDGSYTVTYPVQLFETGETKYFKNVHDKNVWIDRNNKPYQKTISGIRITDKMRESFFEKKMNMLDKDYSSRSIMQNDPTSGIPVDGYTKVLTLANHYVQRKNLKYLGFTAKTLSGNMVDTQTRFENPRELGVLLQTLKDPRIEHLWFVGIKDNKIAKTMHITSDLPHAITYSTAQFVIQTMPKLRRWIGNGTLDSFVMLHNHPGGNPKPSAGDWSYNNFVYSLQMNVNGTDEPMSNYYGGSYINDTDSFSLLLDPKDKEKYYKLAVPANAWDEVGEYQFDDDIPSLEMRKYLRMTLKPHEQMNDIYKPTRLPSFKDKVQDKLSFAGNENQYATALIENPENVLLVFTDNLMLKAVEAFEYQKLRSMQKEDRRDFITGRMAEYGASSVGMVLDGTVVDKEEIRNTYGDRAQGQDAVLGLPSWSDQILGFVYDFNRGTYTYLDRKFINDRQALRHKIVDRGAIHLEAPKHELDAIGRAYSFIGTAIDSINEMLVFVGENQIRFKTTAKELYRNIQKNKWHITEGATDDEIALLNKSLEHLEKIIGVRSTASMKSEASKLKTKTDIREIEYKEFPEEIEINDIHRGRIADIKYQDTRYLSNIFHAWKYLGKSSTKETGLGLLNTMGQKKLVVPMINKLLNKEMMGIDDKVDAYFEPYGGSLVYMLNLDILKKTDKPIYIAVSSKYEPYKALVYKAIKENNKKMINKLYLGIQGLSDDFVIKKAVSLKAGAINKRAVKNFDSIIKAIQKDNVHIVDMDDQEFFNFVSSEIDKGITPLMFDDSNYAELVGEHSSSAYAGGTIEKDPIFLLNKKLPIFSKIKNAGGVVVVTNHIEPVLTEHLLKQYPDMRSWGYLHQAFTTPDFDYGSHIDGYRPEFIGIIRNNQQGNVLDIREAAGLEEIPIDDVPASRYKSRFYIELNKNMKIDFDRGKIPEKNTLLELQETINHIDEIGEYMRHRTETEKKMKKLRGKIYAAIAIKGFNKTEAKKIYKKNTGHNIIKHAEITLSQLDKTLKAIKKKRPVRDYRTKKLVITEKTEKKIKTLKKNLMERGLLTQEVYDQILKINHVKFVGYVTANMFTEEKVAKQILRELNEAVVVSQFSVKAKESLKKFPILKKRVDSLEDIWREVKVDERGEPVSFDITKGFKTMLDMEHFVDLLEKYSGVEFGRFWRHMRDQWLLAHRKVDVILDRLIELGGGKVKMSKIARDEESIKRIENLVASKLPEYIKGKPTVPKDATESEIKIAKYIAMIGRGFERIVRYERFMRWYDKEGHPDFNIPDAPESELKKAKNILETEGDIELRKFLDTRSWGVIGSGYDFGEIFRGTLRFYRGSPGVSTAHLDPKDTIIYREYDRDIINRFATYVRQMMFRHDLNPIIKGWNLLYKASVDRWKSPAKLKDLLEANVQEMLGHRDIPQAYEKFVFQIYSLIARVTFFHPRLGGRNLLQNVALNPGFVTNFIKAGMENLSSKDQEYFKTFVSNNRGIVRDLLYAQYKTDIKGLREIMFVIDEINVMGRTDTINRAASFRSHMSNIMHAIKKYPDYKTSERDRRKFEKEARFYLLTLPQIRHAYEVAATEGNRAMSRYVSWAITARVHFNYIRALREPASQRTDFRRLLSNLMVFRKGFLQMLILDAQKLKYNKAYESTKATNVVNLAYLFAALALKIAIAGELYKTVFGDEERTPYDPESILVGGNVGGLMYGGVSKVVNFFYSTASLLMAPRYEEEERAKRFLKFEKALSDVGKLAVPLWRLFLQVYEASTGTRNIDKLWIKQIEHRMFPDIKSEPSLEYYFKDRNFIKTVQHAIFGTDWKIEKE